MPQGRPRLGLRTWLVLLSQVYLLGLLLVAAASGLLRASDLSVFVADVPLLVALALVAAALVLWWRGTSWPMRLLNASVVVGFVAGLGIWAFVLRAGDVLVAAVLALAFASSLFAVIAGGVSPASSERRE
jgi:hypothetical protein